MAIAMRWWSAAAPDNIIFSLICFFDNRFAVEKNTLSNRAVE